MSGRVNLADLTVGDLLDALADRVAHRVVAQLTQSRDEDEGRWLTTREAARHLGVHPDTLRRHAAANRIPHAQDGPGCTLRFRLPDLDRWQEAGGAHSTTASRASTRLPRGVKTG
ncbi:MAG TPA: helix-turn-helix domain-containing protein [Solirubrobacteraceae bacterium]|nr:helix-turn-helix domain-containing protein [Solirubrobacteraceae bacterium]